jgi:hypothetical protein
MNISNEQKQIYTVFTNVADNINLYVTHAKLQKYAVLLKILNEQGTISTDYNFEEMFSAYNLLRKGIINIHHAGILLDICELYSLREKYNSVVSRIIHTGTILLDDYRLVNHIMTHKHILLPMLTISLNKNEINPLFYQPQFILLLKKDIITTAYNWIIFNHKANSDDILVFVISALKRLNNWRTLGESDVDNGYERLMELFILCNDSYTLGTQLNNLAMSIATNSATDSATDSGTNSATNITMILD